MKERPPAPDEWDRLLAAMRRLQALVPGTILVGGSAAVVHAGHRLSLDGDHVVQDLRDRFDEVLATLESAEGWKTERITKPVQVLGELDGVLTGIRQLRRTQPLETESISGIRVPTLAEMARIKAWMLLDRDTTRDYLDAVVLMDKLGEGRVASAFASFDSIYGRGPRQSPPLVELVDRLAAAQPQDRSRLELGSYKGVKPPWTDWPHLETRGRFWASFLAKLVLERREGGRG